jgi:hypothetical protein
MFLVMRRALQPNVTPALPDANELQFAAVARIVMQLKQVRRSTYRVPAQRSGTI